ncbi:ATP phosphoribosyltransferase [Paracoccaceae bacterium]|nr:ATP phosphoribosyltransferase [Paracoccaceae bacterium]
MVKKFIRLGLPSKGRMKQQVEDFFLHKGLELVDVGSSREYLAKFKQEEKIQIILIAPSDIPLEIKKDNLDIGITGRDLVFEQIIGWQKWMLEFMRLDFGNADLVVGVPQFWTDVNHLDDLDDVAYLLRQKYGQRLRIATKYQNITRDFLIDNQVTNFEIIESQGATEGAIVNGIADVVVDISSTGETLKQNKLKMIEKGTLLRSSASIFVNRKYYKKSKSDCELKRFLAKLV